MIFVRKLLLLLLGGYFVFIGIQVLVLRNYDYLRGYVARAQNGRRDELFARRTGKIYLCGGALCAALSLASLFFGDWFVPVAYIVGVGLIFVFLIINEIDGERRR